MKSNLPFPEKLDITVTCASGVEKVTKTELERLGYPSAPAVNGSITFSGDKSAVARCNINLRTADRVYIKIAQFPAQTFDELYDGVYQIPWQNYLPKDAKIIVNGKSVKSKLFALSACQSIIKKAIIKGLSRYYGISLFPETGSLYQVEFWVFKDEVTLLLNTSGTGLHKRGYRDLVGIAPIKETLASALLLMSDFYYNRPFIDPFCGSGTIVIEGAKIALNIAPNILRDFDFRHWTNFDKKYYTQAYEQAKDNEKLDRQIDFSGYDIDQKAIKLARHHAVLAGLNKMVRFERREVKDLTSESAFGTIVTNPPYGERVYDIKQAEQCYKELGEALKKMQGWSLFAITSAKSFERYLGKRADRERKLYNSNKECRYYYYYGQKEKPNDRR